MSSTRPITISKPETSPTGTPMKTEIRIAAKAVPTVAFAPASSPGKYISAQMVGPEPMLHADRL
ncbi:hypothetical protein, partial [Bacillus haynesii]|uniref:hypothetical protein n=1 Tax=Bacillus haynesii TaxID=1925021 RepID=UPI001969E111